ncbi:MAG: ArsR/SmtB family transcription factor [Gaiellaceae bacterium]
MGGADVLTIRKPEQLKALGHPLRLRVLEVLGESEEELTNRELAARLGVDPGHLHFHVRMLLNAGLIKLADGGQRREKPYRAVAAHVRVARELITSGAANDARAAMLDEVQDGWARHSAGGLFRSAQITIRMDIEKLREVFKVLVAETEKYEDGAKEPLLITLIGHPHSGAREAAEK